MFHDLFSVQSNKGFFFKGEKKQTNYHRIMLGELVRGIIPANWHRYTIPKGCTVIQWITDFSQRIKQLQKISQLVSTAGAKELQVGMLYIYLKTVTILFMYYKMFY